MIILAGGPLIDATHGRLGYTAPPSDITAVALFRFKVGVMPMLGACATAGTLVSWLPPLR